MSAERGKKQESLLELVRELHALGFATASLSATGKIELAPGDVEAILEDYEDDGDDAGDE